MARNILSKLLLGAAVLSSANAYFLFGMNNVITTERIDPIVNPGKVSGHVHTIVGGSNFRVATNTSYLRQSECTSSPIKEDKSNYWAPTLYFQWKNGSFTSVTGAPVMYYLFSDTPGVTTPFPDDFRMLSGTPTLRSYDANSYAQQAVTFLCLDFSGTSTRHNEIPAKECPSGIRAQINFPSCWDGQNADSADHKSHVAFLSGGPDSGSCSDPKFPKTLPRIFMEMYLDTGSLWAKRDQAKNPAQPFVYSMGDPTGYGYHADFLMGWDKGVLQNVVDKCHCNGSGDPTCCSDQSLFTFKKGGTCRITKGVDENVTGTIPALPGNNPVVPLGGTAVNLVAPVTPALISPVYAYTGDSPTKVGSPVGEPVTATGATTVAGTATTAAGTTSSKAAATSEAGQTTKAATTTKQATASSVPATQPTSGSGSGSSSPGNGNGSSSPGKGSSSPGKGSNSPGKGPGSSHAGHGNHTGSCKKTKKPHAPSRRARSLHDSARRRFASPEQRFTDMDHEL
ncbi:WSC domain-containing protein [Mycena crocata]|nr:WSC domain-containing protein [Mycena crocata]